MSAPQMPFPHTHAAPGEDIVTFHASHGVGAIRTHLDRSHGVVDAMTMPNSAVLLRHAEIHAVALSPAEQDEITERDKRTYAAGTIRRLAQGHLGELNHAHLPWQGDGISIVATDEVQEWLLGVAIRIENGADL